MIDMKRKYDDLIARLINYAFDRGIGTKMIKAPKTMPCLAIPEERIIVININWEHPEQVPFTMAHEIAHMTNKDNMILYKSPSCMYRITAERNADKAALDILMPMYFDIVDDYSMNSINPLIRQLGIPFNLAKEVREHLDKHLWYVHN